MANSELLEIRADRSEGPAQEDLDKCVHCGLCLNACPTYRDLGVEMDSPRGRVYQMNAVAAGAPITPAYIQHMELCLACRGCETACPSGVPYGRMIEAARNQIEVARGRRRSFLHGLKRLAFRAIQSRTALQIAGAALYLYQASGLQWLIRATGILKPLGKLANLEALTPPAEVPFFFSHIGKTFPAKGERRYRVAFLAGCIANVSFARLNEATVRVLQANGCDVVIPGEQGCCGALHLHAGLKHQAESLARRNVDAINPAEFDAILTNTAGCGSTLKEYGQILGNDAAYAAKAADFTAKMKDINEFLASIELNPAMGPVNAVVTYQDSCHLAHGQKIKVAPRKLLKSVPGLKLQEMPMSDLCCGSAGVYNVVQNEMAMRILERKMASIDTTKASIIVTANPGCMIQLMAGSRLYGQGQEVAHVVQILDRAYSAYGERN
jgi:glycolate oxidase iron-sulfur subunit